MTEDDEAKQEAALAGGQVSAGSVKQLPPAEETMKSPRKSIEVDEAIVKDLQEKQVEEQELHEEKTTKREDEEQQAMSDDSSSGKSKARGRTPPEVHQQQVSRSVARREPQNQHNNNNNNNNNIIIQNNNKRHHQNHHRRDSLSGSQRAGSAETGQHQAHCQAAGRQSNASATTAGPAVSAEYLAQLIKDKKNLAGFPAGVFLHVPRLIDDEIQKVRNQLFQLDDVVNLRQRPLELPEAEGELVSLQEKIYVPVDEHPEYNFVGRLLGPRGMTAKQLEQETGCKIMIRGKGSMRDKRKEEQNRGKSNWEHLNDELHVLITIEDTENRAKLKLERAIEEVRQLLVPIVDGEDELKKRQLMELAIINGTYRDCNYNETLGKLLSDATGRQNRLMARGSSAPDHTGGGAFSPHPSNQQSSHQQLLAAAEALANGSPPSTSLRHFLPTHYQAVNSANLNGSVSATSSAGGGLPSTGSSTPNSMQAAPGQASSQKGQQQQQQQHRGGPAHHQSPQPPAHHNQHQHNHQQQLPHHSSARQQNLPISPHHAHHLGHSAAIAATAAAIAAAQHHHHHNQGPRTTQAPPLPPPLAPPGYVHMPRAHPTAHQSPAVAAAAAAAAAALMSTSQAGGTPADASALLYAQQYHEFQYAAMAAAASASQQSILQMAPEYGAHFAHVHHQHHGQPPPQPPPAPSGHQQAVAAAAAAAAAAQAHHHHQQEYQRLLAEQQHHHQQHQHHHHQHQADVVGELPMSPHYQAQEAHPQSGQYPHPHPPLTLAGTENETNGNDHQFVVVCVEGPSEEPASSVALSDGAVVSAVQDGQQQEQRLVVGQQQSVSS